ncbi:MAG: protein kinase, partial [bacterium]|nr:protein kinase [bacterium]
MEMSDTNLIHLPGYQIAEQMHEGARSRVYRGVRDTDSRPVVLKVLKENYPSPAEPAHYRQEYDITGSLVDAEGVIGVYGLERYKNTLMICLEDFGAESLRHWLDERPMSLVERLRFAVRAAEILGRIHRQDIIHKDVNPANLV